MKHWRTCAAAVLVWAATACSGGGGPSLQHHVIDSSQGAPAALLQGVLVHHDDCDWVRRSDRTEELVLWPVAATVEEHDGERTITIGPRTYVEEREVRLTGGEVPLDHATGGHVRDLPAGCRPASTWIVSATD